MSEDRHERGRYEAERRRLLDEIKKHPEQDHTKRRERIAVLSKLVEVERA